MTTNLKTIDLRIAEADKRIGALQADRETLIHDRVEKLTPEALATLDGEISQQTAYLESLQQARQHTEERAAVAERAAQQKRDRRHLAGLAPLIEKANQNNQKVILSERISATKAFIDDLYTARKLLLTRLENGEAVTAVNFIELNFEFELAFGYLSRLDSVALVGSGITTMKRLMLDVKYGVQVSTLIFSVHNLNLSNLGKREPLMVDRGIGPIAFINRFRPWERCPTGENIINVIRTTPVDGESILGFKWPMSGYVAAGNWRDKAGGPGLYGVMNQRFVVGMPYFGKNTLFQILRVDRREIEVCRSGVAIKFPRAWLLFSTNNLEAALTAYFEDWRIGKINQILLGQDMETPADQWRISHKSVR